MLSPGRSDIWFPWHNRTKSILNGGNGASINCRSCPGSGLWLSTSELKISLKGCVATFRVAGGDVKESRNGNPTGDLQMAADRTLHHPLYCPVVSSLFSFATRC